MGVLGPDSRVAVLGGGGFLGRHVVRELASRGIAAIVPRTADGWDFRDAGSAARFFEDTRPQVAINCAARQGGLAAQQAHPADLYRDNLLIGLNAMHAAQQAGVAKYVDIVAACSYISFWSYMIPCVEYSGKMTRSIPGRPRFMPTTMSAICR